MASVFDSAMVRALMDPLSYLWCSTPAAPAEPTAPEPEEPTFKKGDEVRVRERRSKCAPSQECFREEGVVSRVPTGGATCTDCPSSQRVVIKRESGAFKCIPAECLEKRKP